MSSERQTVVVLGRLLEQARINVAICGARQSSGNLRVLIALGFGIGFMGDT